jgi:hypothetical protein
VGAETIPAGRLVAGTGSPALNPTPLMVDEEGNVSGVATLTTGDGSLAGELAVYEKNANGVEYRSWLSPDSLTATVRFRFPDAAPGGGVVMEFGAPDESGISQASFRAKMSDPGVDGVPFRQGAGTSRIATANDLGAMSACIDTGATDAYGCSLSPAISAYQAGARYAFLANTPNAGAASLALNGLAAAPLKKAVAGIWVDLEDNDIPAGQWVTVVYAAEGVFQVLGGGNLPPQAGSAGKVLVTDGTTAAWSSVRREAGLPPPARYISGSCLMLWNAPDTAGATCDYNEAAGFQEGRVSFAGGATNYALIPATLPATWDSSRPVGIIFNVAAAAAGFTNEFQASVACAPDGGALSGWNPASTGSVLVAAASNRYNVALNNLSMTGCTAGGSLLIQVRRDSNSGGDNSPNAVSVYSARLVYHEKVN